MARERRGITLRQIANATKISVGVLDALERNDISRLPGGIFGRAFVRSYAVEVGLDPEATIQDFMATFPNDSVTAGHPTSERNDDFELLESDRRRAGTYLSLVAISIPIAGAMLWVGTGRRVRDTPAPAAAVTAARHRRERNRPWSRQRRRHRPQRYRRRRSFRPQRRRPTRQRRPPRHHLRCVTS